MGVCIASIRQLTLPGMDVYEIRLVNVRNLAHKCGGPAEFARKTGLSDSRVSQIIGKNPTKQIGPKAARDIEKSFGLAHGELDLPPSRYSPMVEKIADELELRDPDAHTHVLELIKAIPRIREKPALAASAPPQSPKKKQGRR